MRFLFSFFFLMFFTLLQADPAKTIAILTYKPVGADQTWDPDSISSGITGSEEAVIYMSDELAKLGYKVTVFGYPPTNSSYSDPKCNPRYLNVDEFAFDASYDVAIAWRMPAVAEELKKRAKKVYYWPHDRSWELLLTEKQINAFDDVLWVSEWQRKDWAAKNPGFAKFQKIFGNGINPSQFLPVARRKNPYSCIYGSNYGQGLYILLDIWPKIRNEFPKATLDIYYGWQHFGFITPEKEAHMKKQIAELKSQGVTDHGKVGHKELNKAYATASFWTYPCIGTETFSITALRAQMSGAIPVIIEGSGLLETVSKGYKCTKPEDYYQTLVTALKDAEKIPLTQREESKKFVLNYHTWKHVALRWKELFDEKQ